MNVFVELDGGIEVGSEGLFDDNARPGFVASRLIGFGDKAMFAKPNGNIGVKSGRGGKVKEPVAGAIVRFLKVVEAAFQSW